MIFDIQVQNMHKNPESSYRIIYEDCFESIFYMHDDSIAKVFDRLKLKSVAISQKGEFFYFQIEIFHLRIREVPECLDQDHLAFALNATRVHHQI